MLLFLMSFESCGILLLHIFEQICYYNFFQKKIIKAAHFLHHSPLRFSRCAVCLLYLAVSLLLKPVAIHEYTKTRKYSSSLFFNKFILVRLLFKLLILRCLFIEKRKIYYYFFFTNLLKRFLVFYYDFFTCALQFRFN